MDKPIRIRKSPVLIIRDLILLQLVATALYFPLAVFADYGFYYQKLVIAQVISYQLVRVALFFTIELLAMGYIFLRWFLSDYVVYPNMVVKESGVILRRRRSIPLGPRFSVSYHAGPLGKIFKYGTIVLRGEEGKKPILLAYVPNPKSYLKLITMHVETAAVRNTRDENAMDIADILSNREHENLEFKTTFRWDMREARVNKSIEKSVLKTISAFLNSEGGHLVIGVGNDGKAHGLALDYATLNHYGPDGFENHFTNVFKAAIGPEFRRFVKLSFHPVEEKEVCVVRVLPASAPAYLKFESDEAFYVRTGNSTTALQLSEAAKYIRARWGSV